MDDLNYADVDIYDGPDRLSPFQYKPVNPKKPLSEDEQIVANTLFAMTAPKW